MQHDDQQIINLKEGSGYKYLDILEEYFPEGTRTENGFEYKSVKTGQIVSFAKMIDAATSFQKVRKLN